MHRIAITINKKKQWMYYCEKHWEPIAKRYAAALEQA